MSKKLAMNTTVEGDTYQAGTVPPAEVAKKITNPKAWGSSEKAAEAAPEPAPADPPPADPPADPPAPGKNYEGMSPDDLRAEAASRELEVTGTGKNGNVKKSDLVDALKAHDAAASE